MSMHANYIPNGRTPRARRDLRTTVSSSGFSRVTTFGPDGESTAVYGRADSGSDRAGRVRYYVYGDDARNIDRHSGVRLEAAWPGAELEAQKVLTVKDVDLKIPINSKAHRTHKFAISRPSNPNPQLVVRRGQPFSITVTFSRPYDQRQDDLKLVFEAGTKPLASKRTHVEFILSDEDLPYDWGAKIVARQGNTITMDVFTPPTCFVAKWAFKIDVVRREDTAVNVFRYSHKNPIYILFNPWCKDDLVYIPDEKLLDEYILNETGRLYSGVKTSITSKPWNYGQFESLVLDVAMFILDITGLNWAVRGNPVPIVRKLSALVNSSDDGGILTGRWDGEYDDGTSPLAWTGSVAILEQYWRTKRPVNYGQCWVFAGVTTTICRALGIPARAVTNFGSAHDTDGSITIDYHMRADDYTDDDKNTDSVWNFHVWTEIWTARPDLPPGYGGWQVVDSTPQELSDGTYCCGPASVTAIQQGVVNLPYDGPFVFAEVNADIVYWQTDELGVTKCLYIDKKMIGKSISTKAPNSTEREDLTLAYKHAEDTAEERAAVIKANLVGTSRHDIYKPTANDVKFSIEQDSENSWVGGSFIIGLKMKNNSRSKRSIKGRIVVSTMYYTGVTADVLKSEPFLVLLKPEEESVHRVVVTQDEYDGHLKDGCMMDACILAHVEETNQNFVKKEDYRLNKPHLSARAPAQVFEDQEFKIDVSFTNPLSTTLTNCSVTVDGVAHLRTFPQANVPPRGTFATSLPVQPEKPGQDEVIIIFNSKQLEDINTSCPVYVREK